MDLKAGESITVTCICESQAGGFPYADTFRLPMMNLEKAWYETTQNPRFPPYNYHPQRCEDYNLESGGNTDLGEPLVAPFAGIIIAAHDWGSSLGNVIQLLGVTRTGEQIVWAGWHLLEIAVSAGQIVGVGDAIGAIGNAGGYYAGAHLHNQICIANKWSIPAPTTFAADDRYHWVRPSRFYLERGVDAEMVKRVCEWDGA